MSAAAVPTGGQSNCGVSTDVLGRVVEVVTGQPLDQVFAECIFAPLGMADTSWSVEPAGAQRLAALCAPNPQTGQAVRFESIGTLALSPPECLSGGGGLISTAADYHPVHRAVASRR